jgi:hypothetical protein
VSSEQRAESSPWPPKNKFQVRLFALENELPSLQASQQQREESREQRAESGEQRAESRERSSWLPKTVSK